MPEPARNFYTNTYPKAKPMDPMDKEGFVTAVYKGWAVAANGKKFWFYVYALTQNFSGEDGSGIKNSLEKQYKYKVNAIEKMIDPKKGKRDLPANSRELNYTQYGNMEDT